VNLHVKDFSIRRSEHKMGFIVEGAPAGKGKLDIPGLLARLKALGRCGSAVLELWTPFGPTMEDTLQRESLWAAESMDYLKQL
jgi:L-ribulose-5-phosphate 3-epimerase UlaE